MPMPSRPDIPGATLQEHVLALRAVMPSLGFDFIAVGALAIPFSLLLDPLSSVMILTVTGIGTLIHIYSIGYMSHDEDRVRFFGYLNLFLFFMLMLVLGGSLPLLFIGSMQNLSHLGQLVFLASSFATLLVGELLERMLFFKALSAPKMPGAVA